MFQHGHLRFNGSILEAEEAQPRRFSLAQLALDDQTIVRRINKVVSKSRPINHVMIALFPLARRKAWNLSATHLDGVRNVIADSLSQTKVPESDGLCTLNRFSVSNSLPNLLFRKILFLLLTD